MRATLPVGAAVEQLSWREAASWARDIRAGLRARGEADADFAALGRWEASYLAYATRSRTGNPGYYEYLGATPYGIYDEMGALVGLHVARPSTAQRKNAWGRYVNHYLVFVRLECRRQGLGAGTEAELQRRWAAGGWDRLKTLCQSRLGVYYHEALADQVWGLNVKGELVIDSPLDPAAPFPAGMPIKARHGALVPRDVPFSGPELFEVVTGGRFGLEVDEARTLLAKRAEGAGVEPARTPQPRRSTAPDGDDGTAALPHSEPPGELAKS